MAANELTVRAGMPYVSRVGDIRVRVKVSLSLNRVLNYEGAVVSPYGDRLWMCETLLVGGEKVSPSADRDTEWISSEIERQLQGQSCPDGVPSIRGNRFYFGLKPDTMQMVAQAYPDATEIGDLSTGGDLVIVEGDVPSAHLIGWKLISVIIRDRFGEPVAIQLKK